MLDCTENVQVLTSSSKAHDVGLHKEHPRFKCFPQIIIGKVEENAESIMELTNSKMSSRGGEASGAAGSGRARVSGRQPAAGGGGLELGSTPYSASRRRSIVPKMRSSS